MSVQRKSSTIYKSEAKKKIILLKFAENDLFSCISQTFHVVIHKYEINFTISFGSINFYKSNFFPLRLRKLIPTYFKNSDIVNSQFDGKNHEKNFWELTLELHVVIPTLQLFSTILLLSFFEPLWSVLQPYYF